jgi:hypothetical protein
MQPKSRRGGLYSGGTGTGSNSGEPMADEAIMSNPEPTYSGSQAMSTRRDSWKKHRQHTIGIAGHILSHPSIVEATNQHLHRRVEHHTCLREFCGPARASSISILPQISLLGPSCFLNYSQFTRGGSFVSIKRERRTIGCQTRWLTSF